MGARRSLYTTMVAIALWFVPGVLAVASVLFSEPVGVWWASSLLGGLSLSGSV